MVPITRRRALLGAAGLLAGLAGCQGEAEETPSDTPADPGRGLANVEPDPEYRVLRVPSEHRTRLAWVAPDGETPVDSDGGRHSGVVTDETTAGTLSFADAVPDDRREDVRGFVDATDFDRETLFFHHHGVEQCYRYVLCYVTWNDEEVELRYGQFLRDHDVACDAGERDGQAVFVRVPDALDPDVTSGATGVRRGACFTPPGERGSDDPDSGEHAVDGGVDVR